MDNIQGMVRAKLDRTYGYQGEYYGPGESCLVPAGLASALGLSLVEETEAPEGNTGKDGQALPTTRALKAHLETLTTREQVEALMAIDNRTSTKVMYETRLAALLPAELQAPADALPTVEELSVLLQAATTVAEVEAMQERDPREETLALYMARIAELQAGTQA